MTPDRRYRIVWAGDASHPYYGTFLGPLYPGAPKGWWAFRDAQGDLLFINPEHVSNVKPVE